MEINLIIASIVIGALIGLSIGIGTARMFHAPDKQGLGAFRTLGEINACNGDPVSHFAFGVGFFFNATAAAVGTGALTQDVIHRIIPNWGIALANTFTKKKDATQVMKSPTLLGLSCMLVGVVVMVLIILLYKSIPSELSKIAGGVLAPAANWLFAYVMPTIFLIAALDAGKKIGAMAIMFGVLAQFISGNAVPGIVLGILVGAAWQNNGAKSTSFIVLFCLTLFMFILIAYFRNITWESLISFPKDTATKISNDLKMIPNINNIEYLQVYNVGNISEV